MTTAYPKLRDENFEVVKDVLGLEVIFSPDVEDERVKREYEIYSYRNGSIGRELVELFRLVYEETGKSKAEYTKTIRDYLSIVFPNLPEFAKEFYEIAKTALRGVGWTFPDISTDFSYHIQGIILDRYSGYVYRMGGYKPYKVYDSFECNIPLLRLLDELSAGIFLLNGFLFNLEIKDDTLRIDSLYPLEEIVGESIYAWKKI